MQSKKIKYLLLIEIGNGRIGDQNATNIDHTISGYVDKERKGCSKIDGSITSVSNRFLMEIKGDKEDIFQVFITGN